MKRHTIRGCITMFIGIVIFVYPLFGAQSDQSLKGKVHFLNKEDLSLEKRFDAARKEFTQSKEGYVYFVGYSFMSRDKVHMDTCADLREPYRITVKKDRIKLYRPSKWENSEGTRYETEEGGGPAGIVFLHQIVNGREDITDVHIIDMDRTYEFQDVPIYWLGHAENGESLSYLEERFKKGDSDIKDSLIFSISIHDHPRSIDILYGIARGHENMSHRRNAVFWIGNFKNDKGYDYLQNILKEEKDTELREHAVFAMQLGDDERAVKELINIAQMDKNQKVRKTAIFWLGQKASEESIEALKDVIDEPEEDTEMKQSAVFAISQLPKDQSVPMLIDIAKTHQNPKIRKNAIFWLGQTGDEEAVKFFEEILLKKQ
jgi:hypothetical protein